MRRFSGWRIALPPSSFRPSSRGGARVRGVERLGPAAAAGVRAGERRRGADHRVPVRARPGDADGDHGRHRAAARRRACCQERGGAGAAGIGGHARGRQDRDADRRQAEAGQRDRHGRLQEDDVLRLAAALEQGSEHPLAAAILAAREGTSAGAAVSRSAFERSRARASKGASRARASRSATSP